MRNSVRHENIKPAPQRLMAVSLTQRAITSDPVEMGSSMLDPYEEDGRLPVELEADLTDARVTRVGHNAKARIGNISGWIEELRMVENVKKFEAQIERESLINRGSLQDAEVGVVESGAVEKPAVGSPECSWNAILRESTHSRQAGCCCHVPWELWCRKICRRRDEVASRAVVVGQSGFDLRGFRMCTGPTRFGISVEVLPHRVKSLLP